MKKRVINFLVNLGDEAKEKKYSFTFLLDLSGSMQGEPLEKVKIALTKVLSPLVSDNESSYVIDGITLFTFHSTVQKICPRVKSENFDFFKEVFFKVSDVIFSESGATALFDGIIDSLHDIRRFSPKETENILVIFSDGGEFGSKHSKKDVNNSIRMTNFGYLDVSLKPDPVIGNIIVNHKNDIDKLFPNKFENYIIPEKKLELSDFNFINDEEQRKRFYAHYSDSFSNVRIFSLMYKADWASDRGKKLLNNFAMESNGKIFNAPDPDSIPKIMKELVDFILYGTSFSIRSKLISRLMKNGLLDDDNEKELSKEWFRVISFNTKKLIDKDNDRYFLNNYNKDSFSYPHSVYEFSTEEWVTSTVNEQNNYNKRDFLKQFNKKYEDKFIKIKEDIKSNLLSQNKELNNTSISDNTNVNFVFNVRDILGHSLLKLINQMMWDYDNIVGAKPAYRFVVVLLIPEFLSFTENEKKLLKALLIEISLMNPSVYEVIFITDKNDSSNNLLGYKQLSKLEFENLVVENLVTLNINPLLVDSLKGERKADFISLGSVSLFVRIEDFIERSSLLFTKDFLRNLYDKEKIKIKEDDVEYSVSNLMLDIKLDKLKEELLKTEKSKDLFELLDFPQENLLEFSYYSKSKHIKVYSKDDGTQLEEIYHLNYENEYEFIKKVLFDLRNFLSITYSDKLFENKVDRNVSFFFENIVKKIRNITDNKLMRNNSSSSPLQAEEWVKQSAEAIRSYLEVEFENDVSNLRKKLGIDEFRYVAGSGKVFTDTNPETYFSKLVGKINNFPLSFALRAKYMLTTLGLLVGLITLVYLFSLPLYFIAFSLVALFIYLWGEYKLKMGRAQIRELLLLYNAAVKFNARKKAFDIFVNKSQKLLKKIANKLVIKDSDKEIEERSSLEDVSEIEYLENFKEANVKTLTQIMQVEGKINKESSEFHIDVTTDDYYHDGNSEIITKYGYPNSEMKDFDWDNYFRQFLREEGEFKSVNTPNINVPFNPRKIYSLSETIHLKFDVQEIEKEKRYSITLLDELSEDEQEEVINLYEMKIWKSRIISLFDSFANMIKTIDNKNVFILWRNVARYEIWLKKLISKVKKKKYDNSNIDNIFKLWLKMYNSRRQYRKNIYLFSERMWKRKISENVDIWEIIEGHNLKDDLKNYILAYSYPAFHIEVPGDQPIYFKHYLSSYNNSINELKKRGIESSILNNENWEESNINMNDYELFFSGTMVIDEDNKDDSMLLRDIEQYFKKKTKNGKSIWEFADEDLKFFDEEIIPNGKKKKFNYLSLGGK